MGNFRTVVAIPENDKKLNYSTKALFIGSCFADNIGNRLESLKFPVLHNPFGVLYNPESVKNCLEILLNSRIFQSSDLIRYNDLWISFSHHGSFSHPDQAACLNQINRTIQEGTEFLQNAGFLFLTFGTARVYEYKNTGEIVANCHKLPANEFYRKLLTVDQIVNSYTELITILKKFNKNLKLIFTVSPIRHWKDGAVNNQISKSILLLAIHKIIEKFPEHTYFPAYELFMDDLRDYRFYDSDMLHPGALGIEYTWQRFNETFIEFSAHDLMKEIEKINNSMNHRPLFPGTPKYLEFLQSNIKNCHELSKKYPFLNFNKEIEYFTSRLNG